MSHWMRRSVSRVTAREGEGLIAPLPLDPLRPPPLPRQARSSLLPLPHGTNSWTPDQFFGAETGKYAGAVDNSPNG